MMGGAWFDEYFGNPDNCDISEMEDIAVTTVRDHLGIKEEPFRVISRLQKVK